MSRTFFALRLSVAVAGLCGALAPAFADDLVWEVVNPFRLYQHAKSFKVHEDAYRLVRGADDSPMPADIVQRVERCLNDPASDSSPAAAGCAALARGLTVEQRRRGWAARTVDDLCFNRAARPRIYAASCKRERDAQTAAEDYVLPASHSVSISLAPPLMSAAGTGLCTWRWQPRAGGMEKIASMLCSEPLVLDEVPFAADRAKSGVTVNVDLPGGRTVTDQQVVVDDILVVALGDSFASGEGNPDVPVTFSPDTPLDYQPPLEMTGAMLAKRRPVPPLVQGAPYILPSRVIAGNTPEHVTKRIGSPAFEKAFWGASAQWFNADCHRSQYGYPVRVALELALEDRHRSITLVQVACSGAEVTEGLLAPMTAREDQAHPLAVPAQFLQLTNLLCRSDAHKTAHAPFKLPVFTPDTHPPTLKSYELTQCGGGGLKRPIDLVLLSVGGNDIGFSALAANALVNTLGEIAPILAPLDRSMRFGPDVATVRLDWLDARIEAVKVALHDGFGVEPARVIQTSYEAVQYDETGDICGANPQLGMDVDDKFRLSQPRMQQTSVFLGKLLSRLQCLAAKQGGCPSQPQTGDGTGFTLVTSHQPEFLKRGVCARGLGDADGALMQMPRIHEGEYKPYNPAAFRPYASRTRLFRTPNDAFLTANTHRNDLPIQDIVQPAVAALYSGALHPTAQAHAIVADHVMPEVRRVLGKR
jgi:hypothetical protein